jgi:hypothetical protein
MVYDIQDYWGFWTWTMDKVQKPNSPEQVENNNTVRKVVCVCVCVRKEGVLFFLSN